MLLGTIPMELFLAKELFLDTRYVRHRFSSDQDIQITPQKVLNGSRTLAGFKLQLSNIGRKLGNDLRHDEICDR